VPHVLIYTSTLRVCWEGICLLFVYFDFCKVCINGQSPTGETTSELLSISFCFLSVTYVLASGRSINAELDSYHKIKDNSCNFHTELALQVHVQI
jgi:hypothetical protein